MNNKHIIYDKYTSGFFLESIHILENLKDELVKRLASWLRSISQRLLVIIYVFSLVNSQGT